MISSDSFHASQTFTRFTKNYGVKYSANEALGTFILASDSKSNDSFGDESSLESTDRYA